MSPVDSKAVASFVEIAEDYCELVTSGPSSTIEFAQRMRRTIPILYFSAMELPRINVSFDAEVPCVPHHEWTKAENRIRGVLKEHNHYWLVFNPGHRDPSDPVATSISDDLADIWRDLTSGLQAWPTSDAEFRRAIVWEWRFTFDSHWGRHAVSALKALDAI